MPTFDVTDAEKKSIARAQDRYQQDRDRAADELAGAVAQAANKFAERARAARENYQVALVDVAEGHGVQWDLVTKYEVDRSKGTASFTVLQEMGK